MIASTFLAFAALLGVVSAGPVAVRTQQDSDEGLLKYLTETNPDRLVINPGPGMPTLEELDIKVADFFKPEFRAKHGLPDPRNKSPVQPSPLEKLAKRFDPQCYPIGLSAHINAAYACRDYLNSLGSTPCEAYSWTAPTTMCHSVYETYYECWTNGMTAYPLNHAVSACSDVARGMQWIIDSCLSNNPCRCGVTGINAAWGNGNLLVTIKGQP
jgi:hypothetical protein